MSYRNIFYFTLLTLSIKCSLLSGQNLDLGKKIYQQMCINCHGPELDGGIGPSLVDSFWKHGSSPEAILKVIDHGIPETEMIAYKDIYRDEERKAVRDYILSKQVGMRELVRSVYSSDTFSKKRLAPKAFNGIESEEHKGIPENIFYFGRNRSGVVYGKAKLYIAEADTYHFVVGKAGRTTIFINQKEVHYSDDKVRKTEHSSSSFYLEPGVHDFELMHEEKPTHSYKLQTTLVGKKGLRFNLHGRSLEGNVPRFIKPGPQAKVARKWVNGLPPRTLLCILPNKVIVAYNPVNGNLIKAWSQAEVNQTPSLLDRSTKQTEIIGEELALSAKGLPHQKAIQLLHYESINESVAITSRVDGVIKVLNIAPDGDQSFKVTIQ